MASSPTNPTLAVDMKLLEFARMQFLYMAPNTTGWCAALEACLRNLGFKLQTVVSIFHKYKGRLAQLHQDTLRRRFASCLRWYYALLDATEAYIQDLLQQTRQNMESNGVSPVVSSPPSLPPSSPPALSSPILTPSELPESFPAETPAFTSAGRSGQGNAPAPAPADRAEPMPPPLERPSEYLRRRCHLCFGGAVAHDESFA